MYSVQGCTASHSRPCQVLLSLAQGLLRPPILHLLAYKQTTSLRSGKEEEEKKREKREEEVKKKREKERKREREERNKIVNNDTQVQIYMCNEGKRCGRRRKT